MAKDLNKVQLTGRLGADPEMRYTPEGSAITTFSVASGRQWRDSAGNRQEATEWTRCVAWDKLGEICNQYLTKGARVYVEGRLQTRKYTDREGVERYSTEVVLSDMIMLESRRDRGEPPPAEEEGDDFDREFPPRSPAPAPAEKPAGRKLATPRNRPVPIEADEDVPF